MGPGEARARPHGRSKKRERKEENAGTRKREERERNEKSTTLSSGYERLSKTLCVSSPVRVHSRDPVRASVRPGVVKSS